MRAETLPRVLAWLLRFGVAAVTLVALAQPVQAQIAFRAAANASVTSGTSLTLNVPAGTTLNDVMIASVAFRPCSGTDGASCTKTITAPGGWTQVDAVDQRSGGGTGGYGMRLYVYRKVASASEPASYAWTFGGSPSLTGAVGGILSFSGVDITNPVVSNGTTTNGTSQNVPAPSVNASGVSNTWLVTTHASLSSGTFTPPSGMTERVDKASLATPDDLGLSIEMNTLSLGGATGGTGSKTATMASPPVADAGAGEALVLRPWSVTNFLVEAAGGGPIPAQVAGYPFDIRVTARDANNNVVTNFTGTVTITSTGTLTQGSGTTLNFVNGVLTSHTVTISNTGTFTITATSGSSTGTSAPFTVSALSSWLVAEYRMEEFNWAGTAGEVIDSSNNGYAGRAVNATTANTTPAIAGSPGTCRYAVFNRSNAYVELPSTFPNLTGSFAIAAWIRPTSDVNGDQRIFADDENNSGGYGFSLGDGGSGQLRFFGRAVSPVYLDSGAVITTNAWFFVAAVHDASARTRTIYAWNAAGTLLGTWSDTYTGTWGTDAGVASIGGETAAAGEGVPQWRFGGNIDELKIYSLALTQAQLQTLMAQTHTCPVDPTPGSFNAFETSTASGATAGVIKTKLAGTAFTLAAVALNSTNSAVLTTFTGSVTVDLLDASNNTGALSSTTQCRSSWTTVIATVSPNPTYVSADLGRINVTFPAVANAYKDVRVRIRYTSGGTTVTACSTDDFAIRPASFASVQATDGTDSTTGVTRTLNNTSTTSGVVHRAGRAFTVLGSAVSSTGATTSGYDGTPSLVVASCSVPTGCTAGTLTSAVTSSAGTLSGSATYSEAGVITATLSDATFAAVDAADSTAAERTITSAAITIGRFVPDAYRLTTSTTPTLAPPLCGSGPSSQSFVFVGQPFAFGTNPAVLATPVNAAGSVLANARPRFGTSAVTAAMAASGAPVALTGSVSASSVTTAATATIGFTGSSFTFTRGATAVSSFTPAFSMTVDVNDTTETGTTGNTAIVDEATLTITPIAFSPSASPFYYGRIQLTPSFGDYRRDLVVPLQVQYWNGLGWVPLTAAAACISAAATTFAYSQPTGGLDNGSGAFNCATRVASTVTTSGGRAAITLAKPAYSGSPTPSAATLTLNLLASPAGTSCSAANTTTAATTTGLTWLAWPNGSNPSARITWGRMRGDSTYLRERFD